MEVENIENVNNIETNWRKLKKDTRLGRSGSPWIENNIF